MLTDSRTPIPYWAEFNDKEERIKAIKNYEEKKKFKDELSNELAVNLNAEQNKKVKI